MNTEAYLFSLVEDIQRKEASAGLSALTPKEQVFFLVWAFEAEINNGGFDQFYSNSAGNHAVQTTEALRSIGAAKMAALLDKANAVFAMNKPSPDRDTRQNQLEALTDKQHDDLSALDDAFYEYPDNLSELLASYMRKQ